MKDKELRKALKEADIIHITTEWMGMPIGWRRGNIPNWEQLNHVSDRLDALLDHLGLEVVDQERLPSPLVVREKKQVE